MDVFVARQPIFDRALSVDAYELLFRSDGLQNRFDGADAAVATTQVLANSLLAIGLDDILCGKKAFVNFDRTLLVGGLHSILPPRTLVVEILETVEPDAEVVEACRSLKSQGYTIALDDFVADPRFEPLIEIASVLKVDMMATSRSEQERILETYSSKGRAILAEKVETREEFEWASSAGYEFFQGYFFARPDIIRGQQISVTRIACLQLLAEIQKPELDFVRLRTVIGSDVSFSYSLLRYVNSALFALRSEISSIESALSMVGETYIRHWIALVALPTLAKDKPSELVIHSLVRARFCELIASLAELPESNQAFLTGLFSFLDVLIGLPLDEALHRAGVVNCVGAALLGTAPETDLLAQVYRLARHYEASEWEAVIALAQSLHLQLPAITAAYAASTLWAQQALSATSRGNDTRREVRYSVQATIKIVWQDDSGREKVTNAQVRNISVRGMEMVVRDRIPLHAVVRCNDAKLQIRGSGSVRHCNFSNGNYIIGLEFKNGTGWRDPCG